MTHRNWGITSFTGYWLLSMPGDYDFIQIPFSSEKDSKQGIDERIDHPERFDKLTMKRLDVPRKPEVKEEPRRGFEFL